MAYVFSDREGIRIAIEMEARGEAFYRRAARVSRSERMIQLLGALAEDETGHRAEFERLYDSESARLSDAEYDEETNAYLSAVAADVVFPNGLMGLREEGFDNPAAVLKYAIGSEKDSIMFYTEMQSRTCDAHARDVFAEIARQERGHLSRLQRRLVQLTRTQSKE